MSNIYLKITIEKKWHSQNLILKVWKVCIQVSFWWAPIEADIIEFLNFLLQLRAKLCVAFLLFLFWKELSRFKVKESILFVNQKYTV